MRLLKLIVAAILDTLHFIKPLFSRRKNVFIINIMADTETIIHNLRLSLHGKKLAATFACGGSLNSKISLENIKSGDPFLFYEDQVGQAHRLNFPASIEDLEKLANVCDQATFGRNKEDVLDTEYRSAWKLDNTKFLSSFQPSDYDIIEVIRQLLFPGAVNNNGNRAGDFDVAIVSELYKLNVLFARGVTDMLDL